MRVHRADRISYQCGYNLASMRNSVVQALACVAIFTLFSSIDCYHSIPYTQLGDWVASASIGGNPRAGAVCFVIGNDAYIGMGSNQSVGGKGRLNDLWRFSLDSGWMQMQDFPGPPRSNAVAFSLDGNGYVGTGTDGVSLFDDFYEYDPVANQWTEKAEFPGGVRYDAVGFALQGKGYIGTGYSSSWLNDFYQYDPTTDSWARTPGTSGNFSKRRGAVAFVYKNQAYVLTGSNSGGMARDFWAFDPSESAPWKQLHDITNTNQGNFDDGYTDIEREYASVFLNKESTGDKAYLVIGRNGTLVNTTWAYDLNDDLWTRRSAYPRSGRFSGVAFTIGGKSFVGLGDTGNSGTFDDLEQFVPDKPFNPNDN
jgi:N-acetylneuraminic acid mutarotase